MKRIITCSDGTWNKPGATDKGKVVQTNVEKMFNCICEFGKDPKTNENISQPKAYDKGVGTGYSKWDQVSGGITGLGIDKHIKDMYTFICLNYEPGDHLYLFGFSRGAYTARSLGGFIRNCGVLKPACIHLVDKAYLLYRDRNEYSSPDSDMMASWRKNYCFEDITPIMFIGVWDTVGSLGVPLPSYKNRNMHKYMFHDCTLGSTVKHAYHALAIDERRALFLPTLWEKSDAVMQNSDHEQVMEQRWFAGAHSNVGGGYADSGLSDIALSWLIQKATDTGLCFYNPFKIEIKYNENGELRNSYTSRYWFWRPIWRSIVLNDNKTNQTVDESVWKRYNTNEKYRPKNLAVIRQNKQAEENYKT